MKEKQERLPRYFIRLCSDKAAFEVKFSQKPRLDMESLKKAFQASEQYEITLYTPHIMILKNRMGTEITFSKDGRMLIKKVSDKNEADALAKDVLQIVVEADSTIKR